jgi:hypothetical protein
MLSSLSRLYKTAPEVHATVHPATPSITNAQQAPSQKTVHVCLDAAAMEPPPCQSRRKKASIAYYDASHHIMNSPSSGERELVSEMSRGQGPGQSGAIPQILCSCHKRKGHLSACGCNKHSVLAHKTQLQLPDVYLLQY